MFTIGSGLFAVFGASFCLRNVRYATGQSLVTDQGGDDVLESSTEETVEIPFKRVDLTFRDIHYTVQSSITNEKLELLKGIDGVIESGRMTALMVSIVRFVRLGTWMSQATKRLKRLLFYKNDVKGLLRGGKNDPDGRPSIAQDIW